MADKSTQEIQTSSTQTPATHKANSQEVATTARSEFLQKALALVKRKTRDEKPQSITEPTGLLGKKSTRRTFLTRSAQVAGGLATAAAIGKIDNSLLQPKHDKNLPHPQIPLESEDLGTPIFAPVIKRGNGEQLTIPIPEDLAKDLLTEEELAQHNIQINQGDGTKMYLKRSALEIPLFKDASEGKIGGVVISLVENEVITWNSVNNLPQNARLALQSSLTHPKDYPESFWEQEKTYARDSLKMSQNYIDKLRAKLISGDPQMTPNQIRETIVSQERHTEEMKKTLQLLENRDAAANLYADRSSAIGMYTDTYWAKEFLNHPRFLLAIQDLPPTKQKMVVELLNHPEYHEKVYLYMVTEGFVKPNPTVSYPGPQTMENNPTDTSGGKISYHVFTKLRGLIGRVIRHEIGHYFRPGNPANEYDADSYSYDTTAKASQLALTGDTSGYPFVFVNEKGITVTKNLDRKEAKDYQIAA